MEPAALQPLSHKVVRPSHTQSQQHIVLERMRIGQEAQRPSGLLDPDPDGAVAIATNGHGG